ncbi:hypothetical protein DET1034 [Dehalococcoides mccartyi 195]|uniref:Uncharacterized protein n=1 Tax=Dehalococcoides mccartyi (strain ATCC BAA-2266 / KCTC 15142 / 195) TaxID=243164 RepID=Q3Z7P9_DEHM1|nr:hypothetical protein DET1034 [Dehalococcoides mccartyi 195]
MNLLPLSGQRVFYYPCPDKPDTAKEALDGLGLTGNREVNTKPRQNGY